MCYDVAKVITFASMSPSAKSYGAELFLEPMQAQFAGFGVDGPEGYSSLFTPHDMSANRAGMKGIGERLLQRWTLSRLTSKRGDGGQGGPNSLRAPSNERVLLMTTRTEFTTAEFTTATTRPDWKILIGTRCGAVPLTVAYPEIEIKHGVGDRCFFEGQRSDLTIRTTSNDHTYLGSRKKKIP